MTRESRYPNMSIKKFQEKYPSIRVSKVSFAPTYNLYMEDKQSIIFLFDFYLETKEYYFNMALCGRWKEEFIDDVRLLYKYLLKEYKKREELKRKREEDGRLNQSN